MPAGGGDSARSRGRASPGSGLKVTASSAKYTRKASRQLVSWPSLANARSVSAMAASAAGIASAPAMTTTHASAAAARGARDRISECPISARPPSRCRGTCDSSTSLDKPVKPRQNDPNRSAPSQTGRPGCMRPADPRQRASHRQPRANVGGLRGPLVPQRRPVPPACPPPHHQQVVGAHQHDGERDEWLDDPRRPREDVERQRHEQKRGARPAHTWQFARAGPYDPSTTTNCIVAAPARTWRAAVYAGER